MFFFAQSFHRHIGWQVNNVITSQRELLFLLRYKSRKSKKNTNDDSLRHCRRSSFFLRGGNITSLALVSGRRPRHVLLLWSRNWLYYKLRRLHFRGWSRGSTPATIVGSTKALKYSWLPLSPLYTTPGRVNVPIAQALLF